MSTEETVRSSSVAGRYRDVHLERVALGRPTRIRHHAWAFFCRYVLPTCSRPGFTAASSTNALRPCIYDFGRELSIDISQIGTRVDG